MHQFKIYKNKEVRNAQDTGVVLSAGCAVVIDWNYSRMHLKICILNAVQYFCHHAYLLTKLNGDICSPSREDF